MDNDTNEKSAQQTNPTPAGGTPPTPPETPPAAPETPLVDPQPPLVEPAPQAASPNIASTPLVDTSASAQNPAVQGAPATAQGATSAQDVATPTAPTNPLASPTGGALDTAAPLVEDSPIIGTAPTAKQSPILSSAPAEAKKFEPKYMIPIIVLSVLTVGLAAFLTVELVILKPNDIKNAESVSCRSSAANTSTTSSSSSSSSTIPAEATATSLTIPYSSTDILEGSGTYILSASGPNGIVVSSNKASTVAQFTINWSDAQSSFSDLTTTTGSDTYPINFNQPLTEIHYGLIKDQPFYFFLLEDGTVEFLDIAQALKTKNFQASAPIDGVEDVAKFLTAVTNNQPTILAQQIDGKFYDLSNYLK